MTQLSEIDTKIKTMAAAMEPTMIERRRDLHRHPEPGWTEFRTASFVASTLTALGYDVKTGKDAIDPDAMMGVPSAEKLAEEEKRAIAEGADPAWVAKMHGGMTGIVATMKFSDDGPVVGLRCDMDSNDVTETDEAEHVPNKEGFRSLHPGAMHACGHDGHTTVGLAVAEMLTKLKGELRGTVKLIFQPAEEGVRGAYAMVQKGDVDDVDYMLGSHFGLKLGKTGQIACDVIGFLATSKFDARYTGRPAHAGANPENGRNALLAAATAALNLHAISRHSGGTTRINVGRLDAGSGRNVIADKALLQIETRGATTALNEYMEKEARRILEAAAMMYDVSVEITRTGGAAGTDNTPALAKYMEEKAAALGIFDEIVPHCDFGASEDCAYFIERVQQHGGEGAYILVGTDLVAGHHDSHFNIDEKSMVKSAAILASTVCGLLRGEHK